MKEFTYRGLTFNISDEDLATIEKYERNSWLLDLSCDYCTEEITQKQQANDKAIKDIIFQYVEYITLPTYYAIHYEIIIREGKHVPKTETLRDTIKYASREEAEQVAKNEKLNNTKVLLYDIIKHENEQVLTLRGETK